MFDFLLFAGTTEGRQLAEFMRTQSVSVCVFTATEYGGELIQPSDTVTVISGRQDEKAMYRCFMDNPGAVVIDATHPYAAVVSQNLRDAASASGLTYLRVLRDSAHASWQTRQGVSIVPSVEAAVRFLAGTEGRILLTTGSKNLQEFAALPDFCTRVYARVLSVPASVGLAEAAGLTGEHLLCMQGPFSKEMNMACIRHVDASWLVTKETGAAGGFMEKLDAAAACGCSVLVIGRPVEENGISVSECMEAILTHTAGDIPADMLSCGADISTALIGTGAGGDLTVSAADWLCKSDLVIGARRVIDGIRSRIPVQAEIIYEYRADEIRAVLREDHTHQRAAVLFSGDTGFFSGAAAFSKEIESGQMHCFPGISSLSMFASKTGIPWDSVKIVSVHGRSAHILGHIRQNRYVFCLLGKPDDVRTICGQLAQFPHGTLHIRIGEQLGTPAERILMGAPADFLELTNDPIAVMLIENNAPDPVAVPGTADEAFIRSNVPMTKEEVRTLAVSKLRLRRTDTVYDIGAGTGSVSVEAARMIPDGTVYAVEQNPEGAVLIRQNCARFGLDNLEVVEGHAPEALAKLPTPDAALIGGNKGTISELIRVLLQKNPSVRIVVTAITLETVSAVLDTLKSCTSVVPEIVQITVARARRVGSSHMMIGQNPIYLISF